MAGEALLQRGLDNRRAIYAFCKTEIKTNKVSPSLDEIATAVGLSRTAARYHLQNLVDQGILEVTPGTYRSIRVPDGRRKPV